MESSSNRGVGSGAQADLSKFSDNAATFSEST